MSADRGVGCRLSRKSLHPTHKPYRRGRVTMHKYSKKLQNIGFSSSPEKRILQEFNLLGRFFPI
jgi:hypothetical protein